jgi:hypothetical protein
MMMTAEDGGSGSKHDLVGYDTFQEGVLMKSLCL